MNKIIIANTETEIASVNKLFIEYSDWCKAEFIKNRMVQADSPELKAFNNEKLPGEYKYPTGFLLLAYLNDIPVGCMFLRKLAGSICELKRFYINPKGRGMGLSLQMLNEFCFQAKELGYTRIRISTHHFMSKAISIYVQYGFYLIDNYIQDPLQCTFSMELNLNS